MEEEKEEEMEKGRKKEKMVLTAPVVKRMPNQIVNREIWPILDAFQSASKHPKYKVCPFIRSSTIPLIDP